MACIMTKPDEFMDEHVLYFTDEGMTVRDTTTGESTNVGRAAEELSAAVNAVCADGVRLESVNRMCAAIRRMLTTVEGCAYVEGVVAHRDGREHVTTRVIEGEKYWNSTMQDEEMEDCGSND